MATSVTDDLMADSFAPAQTYTSSSLTGSSATANNYMIMQTDAQGQVTFNLHQNNTSGLKTPMIATAMGSSTQMKTSLDTIFTVITSIVMSSHDLNHTLRHAHRAWLLKQGKLLVSGRRDEVLTPSNLALAYGMNFRRLDIEGHRMLIPTT